MKPERWQKVERIYNAALEQEPEKRKAFLNEACAGDDALRKEVESLLACQTEAGSFIESPAMDLAAESLARNSVVEPSADLSGRRLLHYTIRGKIGAGGMGDVYRATDERLSRDVAIKSLPQEFADDQERLSRFEREAKLLASLNHPNIAAIYSLEESDGKRFIVMELIEGGTLAQRLLKGPLPVDEALVVCLRIAEGLEAAHEKGVIHRDLKPANVMLTANGKVKILDFGLAKPLAAASAAAVAMQLPMITGAMTKPGAILGTAAYMSPEQAKGGPVDKRGDIWALGCILFECLAGRRAFPGDTVSETIAAILGREPDWEALPTATPAAVRKLMGRSLRKDPHERMHDAADMRIELNEARREPSEVEHEEKRLRLPLVMRLAIAGAMLLCVTSGIVLSRIWTPRTGNPLRVGRTAISVSAAGLTLTAGGGIAISPDGQKIVFPASGPDGQKLYLRRLDAWEPQALKGTEGAQGPFFSPDGEWVAFFADGKLLKSPVGGGPTETVCSASLQSYSGAWGEDGRIVFAQFPSSGIWRVADQGGQPEVLTKPLDDGTQYLWPELLPGGTAVLFTIGRNEPARLAAFDFRVGQVRSIIESGANARYLKTGHLIYQAEGNLRAVHFNPEKLEVLGTSRVVAEGVSRGFGRGREYDVSSTGTLVYPSPSTSLSRLVWKDRNGKSIALNLNPRVYALPALSRDGRMVAVNVQEGIGRNVWIGSVEGEPMRRLSFGDDDWFNIFTPDGKRVLFTSHEKGAYNIFWAPADGSAKPEPLTTGEHIRKPTSFSPDGKILLFNEGTGGRRDIGVLDVDRPAADRPFLQTRFSEVEGVFSPDGKYVAYQSNESGRSEVYVTPYPGPGPKVRISTDGGQGAAWNPRGGELFYESPTALMAVRMEAGKPASAPVRLFARVPRDHRREYDVSPDGQRFLMLENAKPTGAGSEINVITNWFEELKRLVPTK